LENAYQEFLVKLEDAKKSVKEDESLRVILEKTETLYTNLKQTLDVELYNKIMPGFSIASIVICLVHILIQGYWSGLVGIIFLSILIVYSRIQLNRRINEVNEKGVRKDYGKLLKKVEMVNFIDYIKSGISLKRFRFHTLGLAFASVLPFVLISLSELILGKLGFIAVILAFIICATFAWVLFQKDLSSLNQMDEQLEEVLELM
jgi:Flp pilus assembly protein TadB